MSNNETIKEKDKPFILALIASAFTCICLVVWIFKPDIGKEMFTASLPLTTTSWGFYFASK